MNFKGPGMIRRGMRGISRKTEPRAVILLYHRIAELKPDPQLLCVSPERFAAHMEHIHKHRRSLSLHAFTGALANGMVPDGAVIVTFDDGYADNLWNAKPVLERYNIPATVFVAGDYVDRDREFPSDELERCVLHEGALPDPLTVIIGERRYSWPTGGAVKGAEAWNITMGSCPTPRHRCYRDLHGLLKPLSGMAREEVLDSIAAMASCAAGARPERRVLTSEELRDLDRDALVEIGSHGSAHVVLPAQPAEARREDVVKGKQRLESILQKPVVSFAYPYGGPEDIDDGTAGLIKTAGFESACANINAAVTLHSDPFRLPRLLIRDWGAREFSERLKMAFDG